MLSLYIFVVFELCVVVKGDWKRRLREGIDVDDDDVHTIVNFEGRRNEKRELSGQNIHDKILPRGSHVSVR